MLENLVIAVESEAQIVDIGRVSGFMQKVREGSHLFQPNFSENLNHKVRDGVI
jgi:hypothetical protein